MGYRLLQVDAFARQPFEGNPAAVCLLDAEAEAAWMQDVAQEMNLSETSFVRPLDGGYELRWFTPAVEVDLCGHATLAAAHVLWEEGLAPAEEAVGFHTRSGLLGARRNGAWIELDFPATPPEKCPVPQGLAAALGVEPTYVGRSRFDYLAAVADEKAVRRAQPDHRALKALGARGVMLTAAGSGPYDFVSRYFAPGSGIDEDPVTGSAHCCLGPYWGDRLGKKEMLAYQASARGGQVKVHLQGDRVALGGQAVTVLRGELV